MPDLNHTNTRDRQLEHVILRTLNTRNPAALRTVACLAHDHALGAVLARAEAAERFIGGRRHG